MDVATEEKLVVNVLQTGDPNQQWVRDIVNRFINRANKLLMGKVASSTIPLAVENFLNLILL